MALSLSFAMSAKAQTTPGWIKDGGSYGLHNYVEDGMVFSSPDAVAQAMDAACDAAFGDFSDYKFIGVGVVNPNVYYHSMPAEMWRVSGHCFNVDGSWFIYWLKDQECPAGQMVGEGAYGEPACIAAPGSAHLTLPVCPPTDVGEASVCGDVVVTASGGPITLPGFASSVSITGPGEDHFFYHPSDNNPCPAAGGVLAAGDSCSLGTIEFQPTAEGEHDVTISVTPSSGDGTSANFTGETYSYSWATGAWGACTGGSGAWMTGPWSPTVGCGEVEQTRTVTCAINANSGTQTREVNCQRSDGQPADESKCPDSSEPAKSQPCTPTDPSICDGAKPDETRIETLNNACDLVDAIQAACAETPDEDFCVVVGL